MTEQPGNDYQSAGENWLKNRGAADINFEKLNRYYAQTSKVSYKPPISAQDMEQFPERNYGIPDDWDYKTSDLGPNGEDKPAGAVGWTPQGEPWYGTDNALSEWSKGVFNNIFSKSNENYRNMQQERFNAVTEFLTLNWDDAHQSMDEARAYKQEYKDWKSGQKEQGEKVKAFGGQGVGKTVSGTLGQTIMGLGQVMDVAAQSAERIVGGMQQLEEVADLSSMGEAPSLVNLAEGKHEAAIEKLPRWAQKPAEFVRGFVETFDLIDLTWDGLRAANVLFGGEGLDKKQKGFSILKDDWEAGRIAYTSWINPAIKEEFTRRYEQGENPYLLQLELENPWAELAGELILDPLNVIGAFNKAGKTAKAVKTNKASWFRTVGETLYNKFKDIEDVTKLEDWTEIANETSKNMKKVSQGLSDLGNDMRLSALATSGKRSFVADMVGQSVSWVAGTVEKSLGLQGTEKIEKIVEVMKFVTNLASDDPEIVADALKNLGSMHKSGFPMKVFLSDGMMNTAYILKEFGGDAKTWDNIKDALNGVGEIEKFNDLLNKRVSSAVNKLFPSLAQRVEAGEKLTNFGQAMLRVENFANSKPMRGINSFFAHVYMGMSPGYAARNMITNFIHVINDEGLAAFKGNPFRVQHFEDELIDIFGQIPKAAERAQGAADTKAAEGFMRIFGLGLEAGREGERRSSIRVYAAATKRVLKNMLQEGKAIPSTAPLVEAGLDPKLANHLINSLIANNGDVSRTAKEFRKAYASGSVDVFRAMGWIDDITAEALERNGIDSVFRKLIRDSEDVDDVEALIAKADEIFEGIEKVAEGVTKEAPAYPTDLAEGAHHIEDIEALVANAGFTDDLIRNSTSMMLANLQADKAFMNARMNVVGLARMLGINLDDIFAKKPTLAMFSDDTFFRGAQARGREFTNKVWSWNAELKSGVWDGRAEEFFRKIGIPGKFSGNLNRAQMKNVLWDAYFRPISRNYWQMVRERHADAIVELYQEIAQAGQKNPEMWKASKPLIQQTVDAFDNAIKQLDFARTWDNGIVVDGINYAIPAERVRDYDDIVRLGAANGVSVTPGKSQMLNLLKGQAAGLNEPTQKVLRRGPYSMDATFVSGLQEELFMIGRNGDKKLPKVREKQLTELSRLLGLSEKEVFDIALDVADDVKGQYIKDFPTQYFKDKDIVQESIILKDNIGLPGFKEPVGRKPTFMPKSTWRKKDAPSFEKLDPKMQQKIQSLFDRKTQAPAEDVLRQAITGEAIQYTDEELELIRKIGGNPDKLQDAEKVQDLFPTDAEWLAQVGEDVDLGIYQYSYEAAEQALKEAKGADFVPLDRFGSLKDFSTTEFSEQAMEIAFEAVKIATPDNGDVPKTLARGFDSQAEELAWLKERLQKLVRQNYGNRDIAEFDQALEPFIQDWFADAGRRTAEMRLTADQVATASRDFALLNYGEKTNLQVIMSMTHPYSFWYTGTYPKWMQRVAENPALIAHYHRYRRTLEKIHAGQPDWWKYNVNTNELLGLDSKNPLFFNLEATINPMYGLTGVDFDDPYKNVDAFSNTINDLNRFGPSMHTMFSVVNALRLYQNGEKDAAARWAGRLIPATQTFQAASSLLGFGPTEIDPFVNLFSGGVDPYTKRRVARALSEMTAEGMLTEEQAIDAARQQGGTYWNMALERAVTQRAPGQLSSFFLGVGFKARSIQDMSTDMMYQDYFNLLRQREILSPDEFRIQMDKMHEMYPQMNTVLISDDSEYAYNVLGRIPPGASSDFYRSTGLNKDIVNSFYQSKGDLSGMTEGDRLAFMSAIVDLGALLAIPENGTRQEWTAAKNEYKALMTDIRRNFGDDIENGIDLYYGLYRQDKNLARAYLEQNPAIGKAMDYKAAYIAMRPQSLIATYYGGIEQIENYYKGQMYDEAEVLFGKEIWSLQSQYFALPKNDRKTFLRNNPNLKEYWDYKSDVQSQINAKVVSIGGSLREGAPVEFRDDLSGLGYGAQEALQNILAPENPYLELSVRDWQEQVGEDAFNIAIDALRGQRQLSYREQQILRGAADNLDLDENKLIQYIGLAMQKPQFSAP